MNIYDINMNLLFQALADADNLHTMAINDQRQGTTMQAQHINNTIWEILGRNELVSRINVLQLVILETPSMQVGHLACLANMKTLTHLRVEFPQSVGNIDGFLLAMSNRKCANLKKLELIRK